MIVSRHMLNANSRCWISVGCILLFISSCCLPGQSTLAQTPDGATPPKSDPLSIEQQQVASRFQKLEELLLRSAELESAENPARAALLQQAAQLGKKAQLSELLVRAASSLDKKQYSQALDDQKTSRENLKRLLDLLQSENRGERVREQRDQVRRWIEETDRLLRLQKSLSGRTEGGQDAKQAAEDQDKLSDKAKEISSELGGKEDASDSADKKAADDKSSPKSDGEKKPGDQKEGEQKDGKSDSSSENKEGSDDKEPKESDPSNDKSKDKPDENTKDAGKKSDDDPNKSADKAPESESNKTEPNKSGDSKQQESKPQDGKSKDGKSESQKSEPKQSDSQQSESQQSESQKSESQQSESQQSDGQSGKSGEQQEQQKPPEAEPKDPTERARKRIEQAKKKMEEAEKELKDDKRKEAVEKQRQAEEELRSAIEALEEILRQLREEEIERSLASLETRLRRMLEMQTKVFEETQRLQEITGEQATRQVEIRASSLALEEKKILSEGERAFLLLSEEGSSAAFPEAMQQVNTDIAKIVERLTKANVDKLTVSIEQETITSLEEMIAALVQVQKDKKEKKDKKNQQGQQQQGEPGDQPLVDKLAELRLIRTLQVRINSRTTSLSQMLSDPADAVGQATEADLLSEVKGLAERQASIRKVARDIVIGADE